MLNDPLSNAMSAILNCEKKGKKEITIRPISKVIKKVLALMQDNHYIGEIKVIERENGDFIIVSLLGNINQCGSIKPRFSIGKDTYEKFEKRFLPAKDFGYLFVSTTKGIMTHLEAKKQNIGGKLIAYCY